MTIYAPDPRQVWITKIPSCGYEVVPHESFPELEERIPITTTLLSFRGLLAAMGLDQARYGQKDWNPLGELVAPGQTVVIKPNWVLHHNQSGRGLECVVTHPSLISALCAYLFKARPGKVVLGDAPVQGCDFQALCTAMDLDHWIAPWKDLLTIRDFRLVVLPGGHFTDEKATNETRDETKDYIRFDLGAESLLEPITSEADPKFRVTMYNPDSLQKTHARGRHQYLIARELIEADVVFNLPKLKTHKKSGVTGALKNLIGINGHKEFLPHHRKGGQLTGGDCYPGGSRTKSLAESLLDRANRLQAGVSKRILFVSAYVLNRLGGREQAKVGLEGSWYGNDTIWRTCMDLQRVLHYGRLDGRLDTAPQRMVWSLTDGILAGEGEGPLAPTPKPLGLLTFSCSPVSAEWVHALAMGLDPTKIPIIKGAFQPFSLPLVKFQSETIQPITLNGPLPLSDIFSRFGSSFLPPLGWRGHCEREEL